MPDRSARAGLLHDRLRAAAQEHRGELMMEALVAACAVLSHADGRATGSERLRALALLQDDPLMAVFPRAALRASLDAHDRAFAADPAAARAEALRRVGHLASQPHKARMVLEACATICRADGRVGETEVAALRGVRDALGLAPGQPDPAPPGGLGVPGGRSSL